MAPHRLAVVVLFWALTSCTSMPVVRLDTEQGRPILHISRTDGAEPVELEEQEFTKAIAKEVRQIRPPINPEQAARAQFEVPPRSGWYRYTQREGVVPLDTPLSASQWAAADARITQEYLRLCEALGKPGDCRRVLMNNPVLTGLRATA